MRTKAMIVTGLLTLLFALAQWPVQGETTVPGLVPLLLKPADFLAGSSDGIAITDQGVHLTETAVTGIYTSAPIQAPMPFNIIVPEWRADTPDSSSLHIALRSHNGNGIWTEWQNIHENHDWQEAAASPDHESTDIAILGLHAHKETSMVGEMYLIPNLHSTHTFVQVRISLGRYAGNPSPTLHELNLVFIDTSNAPTTEEALAQQAALDAAQGVSAAASESFPKPSVISRQVWCPYPGYNPQDCFPSVTYYPVTHLILHHTVTNNTYQPSESISIVQAIWRFHTYTRGWGDIGYQYLVDLYGVGFEGRYGGDNVVGIHASGANRGSMAVSLIGNFELNYTPPGIVPPTAMLNKAADLFAWKADQRGINVFEASSALPDIPWGLPTLMGHRDVYGGNLTSCPGSEAFALMPTLRQMVAGRIGLVDPHLYVDELSSGFVKSNANWYVAPGGCGHNNHAYYTWSTTDPAQAVNWGEWRPQVPANGRYRIEAYAPYCNTGRSETTGARYTITHRNGVSTVIVNQDAQVGLWIPLGEFDLNAGTGNVIHLTDLTTTDNGRGVWFDAIRLLPIEGTAVLATPAANVWLTNRTVTFNWSFTSPGMVTNTRLRVATDPGMTQLLVDMSWPTAVTDYTHTFSQDDANLYWQVIMTGLSGNQVPSEVRRFSLDSTPPDSAVTSIARRAGQNQYTVGWQGSDALSGLAYYNVQYRQEGTGNWVNWISQTTARAAIFDPPIPGAVYWFRTQAVDQVGNVEPYQNDGDMNTTQVVVLTRDAFLPAILKP